MGYAMNFKSDNTAFVSPSIMQAMIDVNSNSSASYGQDEYSQLLKEKVSKLFEKEVSIFLTNTGTAANCLALSALVKPYETIYCHQEAHISKDECGGPEFFTGGAKVQTISGLNGKIDTLLLSQAIEEAVSCRPRMQKPGCISITQATECGTVYTIDELHALHQLAQKYSLPIHMDGARFANALVTLGCTPAEMTWKVGIDVLSLGATKNGVFMGEIVIFFNDTYAHNADYLHRRSGQLMAKTRYVAAQLHAYFKDGLWLANALYTNKQAALLASLFNENNVPLVYPVEGNTVFVHLSDHLATYLIKKGVGFYPWFSSEKTLYRFVTSLCTTEKDIDTFSLILKNYIKE